MGKNYAYLRVSTSSKSAKQDFERQLYILDHSGIVFDEIFMEHISGGVKGDQRKEFNRMSNLLQEDDTVSFTETSRFGRNYIDCFDILDIVNQQKKCNVKFLSNGITLEGGVKMNPYTWMTVSQFFLQDEFLKRQIGYNTSNALQRKKEQGVKLGRASVFTDEQRSEIIEAKRRGETCVSLAERYGVNASTISRIK